MAPNIPQDCTDSASIRDRVINIQTKVGAHNAKHGEGEVAHQFMGQPDSDLHQGDKSGVLLSR